MTLGGVASVEDSVTVSVTPPDDAPPTIAGRETAGSVEPLAMGRLPV